MRTLSLGFFLLLAAFAAIFALRTPDTDLSEMTAKYANGQSGFIDGADGLRIHYRDQGPRDAQPIVLLHGNSASLHTWEPLIHALGRDRFRFITYTHPGHGLTGPNADENYQYSGYKQALDAVVSSLNLNRFVLGGNSMGGWISWRYALDHPERVDALILLDASGTPLAPGEDKPALNFGFRLLQSPAGRFLAQHVTPRRIIEQSVYDTVSNETIVTDDMVDRYWELLRLPGNRKAAGLRMALQGSRDDARASDRLDEIAAPTLIIWGEEDQLIPVSTAKIFSDAMKNERVIIYPGIGHLPMEEAPADVARDIDDFLSAALSSEGTPARP